MLPEVLAKIWSFIFTVAPRTSTVAVGSVFRVTGPHRAHASERCVSPRATSVGWMMRRMMRWWSRRRTFGSLGGSRGS